MLLIDGPAETEFIAGWLTHERSWFFWVDGRRHQQSRPDLIAMHVPTRGMLAIFARPGKPSPINLPDVSWLPASWIPVVWRTDDMRDVRRWLAAPVTDPPGVVLTTRDGAK